MAKKVEQLTAQHTPDGGALIVISESGVSKGSTIDEITQGVQGNIDTLETEVNTKADSNPPILPGTKTKISYDEKGLVTGGTNATTADINESTDRKYLTDAQQTYLSGGVVDDSYAQPDIQYLNGGLPFKCIDLQIVTKFRSWDFLSPTQRNSMLDEVVATGANYVALAVPYEQLTKYTDWVTRARAKGLKVWHRSHRNGWEGSDGVGTITSIARSGTTATVVASAAHGLVTGDKIWISGASPVAYNGLATITVIDSTTFTYQVAGNPTTPATGTMRFRLDWSSMRVFIKSFITTNPTLFKPGDLFGMAVENSNADGQGGGTYNLSFRTNGNFDIDKYKQSQLDQVFDANQAFASIGLKKKIYTWAISTNVSLLNLNGVTWNNTGGNASGLTYKDFIDKFGGVVCLDHYQSDSILDAATYRAAIRADLQNFRKSMPGCLFFQGEIGYHTTTAITEQNQADVTKAIAEELLKFRETIGINFWVQMGSTTTSYWSDVTGTIVAGGKLAVRAAIIPAFKKNELYEKILADGVVGANRESINFSGNNIQASITDNDDQNRADIQLIPLYSKGTRTNLIPNPSFEPTTLLTGWSNYGTADTRDRVTDVFNNGVASFHISDSTLKDGGLLSSAIVLPAGTYTLSCYKKCSALVDHAHMVIKEVGGAVLAQETTGYPGNTNFNRVSVTFTTLSQKNVEIYIGLGSFGGASDGEAWFDGLMLELIGAVGAYFDGGSTATDSQSYSWAGTSGNSSSIELTYNKLFSGDNDLNLGGPGAALTDLTVDGGYQGIITKGTAGATLAFGDLCYLDDDGKWRLAGAGLSDSFDKKLGMCVLAASNLGATRMLVHGIIRADAKFPTLSVGKPVFMNNTLGAIGDKPTSSGQAYRIIGFGDTGDQLYFQPDGSFDYVS